MFLFDKSYILSIIQLESLNHKNTKKIKTQNKEKKKRKRGSMTPDKRVE